MNKNFTYGKHNSEVTRVKLSQPVTNTKPFSYGKPNSEVTRVKLNR